MHKLIAKQFGLTLIELMLATVILIIVTTLAYVNYQGYVERTKTVMAISDITIIEGQIERVWLESMTFPPNLNAFNFPNDPWGNPYQYLNMSTVNGNGKKRKDRNLVPLNTDYDLYSKGPDGQSVSPLTAAPSRDDIIRANNGSFVGKAEDY